MKKIIIAGAALAAVSVFTVSAFASDTSNEINTSALSASDSQSAQCTQEYCPQDDTGNRYGAENENGNGGGVCNPSCPQDGTGNRYGGDNGNKNANGKNGSCNGCQSETCTNLCSGSQQRLRLYSEK